mgnify:CR=1 FL=1
MSYTPKTLATSKKSSEEKHRHTVDLPLRRKGSLTEKISKGCLTFIALMMVFSLADRAAHAQCSDEDRKEIYKINKKGMEYYQNMEFKKAQGLLQKAFKKAKTSNCTYDWIHARTLMNLGILCGGGLGKKRLARKFFIQALRVRPEAPLDKEVATPVLKKIYRWARKRLRIQEDPKPWPKMEEEKPPPRPGDSPPSVPLEHDPISQAPQGMPLEMTCRVSEEVQPKEVKVFYRPFKESAFKSVLMKKTEKPYTWTATIPGKHIWGRSLQYYIQATPKSDKALASSGSMISPHIIEIVSEGGRSDKENPFIKKKGGSKKGSSSRKFWVQVGPAFGVGLAKGQAEVIDEEGGVHVSTGVPLDRIETPGFAPGSLGGTAEFGYYIIPKLLLSLQGRFGYIKMLTKNVPGAAVADFAVLVRARYDILSFVDGWLGLYAGGGLGFAQLRHAVKLELEGGTFTDTDLSMGIAPSGFAGLTIGKHKLVKGYFETGFLMTVWSDADLFTFHLDFSLGVCFSF